MPRRIWGIQAQPDSEPGQNRMCLVAPPRQGSYRGETCSAPPPHNEEQDQSGRSGAEQETEGHGDGSARGQVRFRGGTDERSATNAAKAAAVGLTCERVKTGLVHLETLSLLADRRAVCVEDANLRGQREQGDPDRQPPLSP
jgi:hypothetical protein